MFVPDYAVSSSERMIILAVGLFNSGDIIHLDIGEPQSGTVNPTLHLSIFDPTRKCYSEEVALVDMPEEVINLLYDGAVTIRDMHPNDKMVDIEVFLNDNPSGNEGTFATIESRG